jgi:hypothetical protein
MGISWPCWTSTRPARLGLALVLLACFMEVAASPISELYGVHKRFWPLDQRDFVCIIITGVTLIIAAAGEPHDPHNGYLQHCG